MQTYRDDSWHSQCASRSYVTADAGLGLVVPVVRLPPLVAGRFVPRHNARGTPRPNTVAF